MGRFLSILNLAYRFNVHMLKKPFMSDVQGKAQFLERYGPEGLFPLPGECRQLLPDLQGCISCGLCDTVCPHADGPGRHLFNGPSELASSYSRDLTTLPLLRDHLDRWTQECDTCNACEAICPTGVPLRQLVVFTRAILDQWDE